MGIDWKRDLSHLSEPEDELNFPNIMSGVAGDFANLYSNYLEPPHQFFYMSFLTCLGSILADRLTLASEISQQPRLYVLLLSPAGLT